MNDITRYVLETREGEYVSIPASVLEQSEKIFCSRESVAEALNDNSLPMPVLQILSRGYTPGTVSESVIKDAVTLSLALGESLDNCEEAKAIYKKLEPVLYSHYRDIAENVGNSIRVGPCKEIVD